MDNDTNTVAAEQGETNEIRHAALEYYLRALVIMGQSAADICPHIGTPYNNNIKRLRQRIAFSNSLAELDQSVTELESDLQSFAKRTADYYGQKTADIAGILDIITQSVETFESRDLLYLEQLGQMTRQMEAALSAEASPETLRATYARQLDRLRSFVESLRADSQQVFDGVRNDLSQIEDRLLRSEAEAKLDPLTYLVNRREMNRLIRERFPNQQPFSLLVFDIKRLCEINERFGTEAGDQVLQQLAARLGAQVRPRDILCRWGGDEFGVVFDCEAKDTEPRVRQISQWVEGRYTVSVDGAEWKPTIEVRVIVVEYTPGESAESFFERADAAVRGRQPEDQSIEASGPQDGGIHEMIRALKTA